MGEQQDFRDRASPEKPPVTASVIGRRTMLAGGGALMALTAVGMNELFGPAQAAHAAYVAYQMPFDNPNVAFGWNCVVSPYSEAHPHRGLDFSQPEGTPIPAAAAGTVALRTSTSVLGNVIVLSHADGMYSAYCHMVRQSTLAQGANVSRTQIIGNVGTTGSASTGNHLHLVISPEQSGYYTGTTVDPYTYINDRSTTAPPTSPQTMIARRNNNMASLYYTTDATGTLFALAGDGRGPAGWLETRGQTLANSWAEQHGNAALLALSTFNQFKTWYLTP